MLALGIDIGGSSVKVAAVRDGRLISTSRSPNYHCPALTQLGQAMRAAVDGLGHFAGFDAVGLCVPGLLDESRGRVVRSVNIPELAGVAPADLLVKYLASPQVPGRPVLLSDTNATALDLYHSFSLSGRLFALVIGTGVGAAVMDESGPLRVDGDSPGHFGQIDVGLEGPAELPILGPDGGAGGLEAYIGAAALRRAYGPGLIDHDWKIHPDDPPIRALARAIRIAHALYRPHHVYLAGGLGIRLAHLLGPLRQRVETHLTNIARPHWTLATGTHDHHAAVGAAGHALRMRVAKGPGEAKD